MPAGYSDSDHFGDSHQDGACGPVVEKYRYTIDAMRMSAGCPMCIWNHPAHGSLDPNRTPAARLFDMKSLIIKRFGRPALLGLACATAIGLSGCVAYPYGDAYVPTGAYAYPSDIYYGGGYGYYGPYYGGSRYYGGRCCYPSGYWNGHGHGGWNGHDHGGGHNGGHGGGHGGQWSSGGHSGGGHGGGGGGGGHGR